MDPLTQGLFGAGINQYTTPARKYRGLSLMIGFLAGMAADLDILINSQQDPLLFLHYHRQFTHSLIFIPIAALIISGILYPLLRKKISFTQIYLFAVLGYATHGLLDACTSYGTQLFWPISDLRIAWNLVSVIDPLVTIPMLVLMALLWIKKKPIFGQLALAYAVAYICLGAVQQYRATEVIEELAQKRGHQPTNYLLKPTLGNLLLWRSIYEYQGTYYVDAVRVFVDKTVHEGASAKKLKTDVDLPWLQPDSQQAKDISRYSRYSDGYLALDSRDSRFVYDIRYSMMPDSTKPLWGIRLKPEQMNEHVEYRVDRSTSSSDKKRFVQMLFATKAQ